MNARDVLSLPGMPAEHRLRRVLERALARTVPEQRPTGDPVLWDAAFHGLAHPLFEALPEEAQRAILARASADLIQEAWGIERLGLSCFPRLAVEAPTREERHLCSLFAGDEARHLALLTPWADPEAPPGAFHGLLADLIAHADRPIVVLMVQVVLEGWGLRHYRALADSCRDPGLSAAFETILEDEVFHHGAGAVVVAGMPWSAEAVAPWLDPLLAMVHAGPVGTIEAVEAVLGPLGEARGEWWAALQPEAHVAARLAVLDSVLAAPGLRGIRARLDGVGRG